MQDRENDSKLHQIMGIFEHSFKELKKDLSELLIEKLSILVHEVMSARWRKYHVSDHIIFLAETLLPIGMLSAMFHDIVFLQVDLRIHPRLIASLRAFNLGPNHQVRLPPFSEIGRDDAYEWIYLIFQVEAGQVLNPRSGINELLSAVVAAHILGPYLTPFEMIWVIASIEATIAFRRPKKDQPSVAEALETRVRNLTVIKNINLSEDQIFSIVRGAVEISNRDVANFGFKEIGLFLDSTWKLILEDNAVFRNPMFTLSHYRVSLTRVEMFYRSLVPEVIFKRYQGYPSEQDWDELMKQTRMNLRDGIEYIQLKSLALGILEGIAALTGGVGPLILFMGSIPIESRQPKLRMENHLDQSIPEVDRKTLNPTVLALLEKGRPGPIDFDIQNSPLAAYIYLRLNGADLAQALKNAQLYFEEHLTALQFLKALPQPVIVSIMKAVAKIAWSRKHAIAQLEKEVFSRN